MMTFIYKIFIISGVFSNKFLCKGGLLLYRRGENIGCCTLTKARAKIKTDVECHIRLGFYKIIPKLDRDRISGCGCGLILIDHAMKYSHTLSNSCNRSLSRQFGYGIR